MKSSNYCIKKYVRHILCDKYLIMCKYLTIVRHIRTALSEKTTSTKPGGLFSENINKNQTIGIALLASLLMIKC